jgi:hypothetical protein
MMNKIEAAIDLLLEDIGCGTRHESESESERHKASTILALSQAALTWQQAKAIEAEILNASSVILNASSVGIDLSYEEDAFAKAVKEHIGENGSLLKWDRKDKKDKKDKMDGEVQVGQTQTQAHEEVNRIRASMGLDELPSEQHGSVAFGGESEVEAIMSLLDSKSIESEVEGRPLTPYERVQRVLAQAEGKEIVRTRFVSDSMQYEAFKQDAQELKDAHDILDGFNIPNFDADGKTPLRIRMQVHAMCDVDKVEARHRKHIASVCAERDECETRHDATRKRLLSVVLSTGSCRACRVPEQPERIKERVRLYRQENLPRYWPRMTKHPL